MNLFAEFPPALILILGALAVPLLPLAIRRIYVIALPLAALLYIIALPESTTGWEVGLFEFTKDPLQFLRVDKLSKAFGIIFALNAVIAFIFAFYVKGSSQHVAALLYIGGALGAVFSGDLLSLYVFWELMAVASTIVIISRKTEQAKGAAFRYVMIHLLGGLLLLAGIILTIQHNGGDIRFIPENINLADKHWGVYFIVAGILVNVGAVPLGSWLADSYPSASLTGGLVLSAYTTKTSVYALLRGFGPTEVQLAAGDAGGWEPLIWVGCIMAIYGIIYAFLENDMLRIIAFAIVSQAGFMVVGAGVGTAAAVSGATAHAMVCVLYISLLWMSSAAVLYRTGKSKFTDLGGLYKSMPLTLIFAVIGAATIAAAPFTGGFVSKPIIIAESLQGSYFNWPWLLLEIASVGVVFHAGLKLPYFVFFGKDRGLRPKEAPPSMLFAMLILAILCIFAGVNKDFLYSLLPYDVSFKAYSWAKVVHQFQLLMGAALGFYILLKVLKVLKPTPTISLDFDWFYRKGTPLLYTGLDKSLNGINAFAKTVFVDKIADWVCRFFDAAPSRALCALMFPVWKMKGLSEEAIEDQREMFYRMARRGTFAIGLTVFLAVVLLALLSLFTGIAAI